MIVPTNVTITIINYTCHFFKEKFRIKCFKVEKEKRERKKRGKNAGLSNF